MIPLTLVSTSDEVVIRRISGLPECKKHLADLGFVAGDTVKILSAQNGNLIVNVKGARIAVSREMAQKIMV